MSDQSQSNVPRARLANLLMVAAKDVDAKSSEVHVVNWGYLCYVMLAFSQVQLRSFVYCVSSCELYVMLNILETLRCFC